MALPGERPITSPAPSRKSSSDALKHHGGKPPKGRIKLTGKLPMSA
jgi:hypothetical protein